MGQNRKQSLHDLDHYTHDDCTLLFKQFIFQHFPHLPFGQYHVMNDCNKWHQEYLCYDVFSFTGIQFVSQLTHLQ